MNKHQILIIKCLENQIGDDTYRAECAFRGMTPEQMQEQCGQSGSTRQSILDAYRKRDAEYANAIAWVKGVVP